MATLAAPGHTGEENISFALFVPILVHNAFSVVHFLLADVYDSNWIKLLESCFKPTELFL